LPASAERRQASREIPEALRRDVGLLGRLLGQVIAEQGGADLLADVERLRWLLMTVNGVAAGLQNTG
jgi:phosphoenolpyruvate carboxylase